MQCDCDDTIDDPKRPSKVCNKHFAWLQSVVQSEREEIAALTDAWPNAQKYTADRFTYGVQMATELADAIRARSND